MGKKPAKKKKKTSAKKKKKKTPTPMYRKPLKIEKAHHYMAIGYYGLMIILAMFMIIFFVYIRTILDPYLQQLANYTSP